MIANWGFAHVDSELLDDTVDAAVGATLLIESMDKLVQHGVDRERLLKKLRKEPSVWSTWAEFRAADTMARWAGDGAEVRLEEGRSKGAHADFRVVVADDPTRQAMQDASCKPLTKLKAWPSLQLLCSSGLSAHRV